VCDCNSRVVCDCKTLFCVSLQTLLVILWLQKKAWTSVWLQLCCGVIATRRYLWLQHDWVCVVKSYLVIWLFMIASLSSVWLQTTGSLCDCKLFLCVSLQTLLVVLWLQKKSLNQCVIATILRVWLQPEVICGCKTWLCLCGWKLLGYLVYDCKPE
jgi:hypothetical protein